MSQQQTWTEWFFGPTKQSANDPTQPTTGSTPAPASDSSSSPYGPYVRTGRGGAGNFTWQSEQHQGTQGRDEEARKTPALIDQANEAAAIEQHDTQEALRNQRENTQASNYVRVGRGYVDRKELQAASKDTPSQRIATQNTISSQSSETPRVVYRGRGGAGNYAVASEVSDKQKAIEQAQERLDADQRREQIIDRVDGQLPAPPEAWLGGSR